MATKITPSPKNLDAELLTDVPRVILEDYAGPASYQPGGFVVTTREGPTNVNYARVIQATGGYVAEVTAISGSNISIKTYSSGATEATSGTNLTPFVFTVLEKGL